MSINQEVERVNEMLLAKRVSCHYEVYQHRDLPVIAVDVIWGDWKHDHLSLDRFMEERGYLYINTIVNEEDGSDCYSATHYYLVRG